MYKKYFLEDVLAASSQKRFTVISCFAGGGGSSLGYRLGGGDVILINEFVAEAIRTYSTNFPDTKVLVDDIKKYSSEDFLKMANISAGDLDILDGSPPCSAFSMSGKRDKNWGKEKTYSDGKKQVAIEDLFFEFVRIAKGIQPKVIVAENVKGLTIGESRKKLNQFVNAFENIGYRTTYKVLSAADYGVPQTRERIIFICVRDDVCDALGLHYMNLHTLFPDRTVEKYVTVGEAISDIENDPAEVQMLLDHVQKTFQKKYVEMLPVNPRKIIGPDDKQFRHLNPKGSCFNMKRLSMNLPSYTITQMGQSLSASGLIHPLENRKLTVKECKRIMGFPDDYQLTGKFDQQIERLGRSVAPLMYKEVSNSIYEKILRPYNEK